MARCSQRLFLCTAVICLLVIQSLSAIRFGGARFRVSRYTPIRTGGGYSSSYYSSGSSSLSTGEIVGIVVGCVLGTIILIVAIVLIRIYCCKTEKKKPGNSAQVISTNTMPISNIDSSAYSHTNNQFNADQYSHTNNGFNADQFSQANNNQFTFNDKSPAYDEIPRSTHPN